MDCAVEEMEAVEEVLDVLDVVEEDWVTFGIPPVALSSILCASSGVNLRISASLRPASSTSWTRICRVIMNGVLAVVAEEEKEVEAVEAVEAVREGVEDAEGAEDVEDVGGVGLEGGGLLGLGLASLRSSIISCLDCGPVFLVLRGGGGGGGGGGFLVANRRALARREVV